MLPCKKEFTWIADRKAPWKGLSHDVAEAKTSAEALVLANLDWEVAQKPSYIDLDGQLVPTGEVVNYRTSDNKILGTVSSRYRIVQNAEAFSFTDNLIGEGVSYEAAGSLDEGRVVWLMAKLPEMEILGDQIGSHLLFSNGHDGKFGVKCCVTNIRIACENMLNLIVDHAIQSWSFGHFGDITTKIAAARKSLEIASAYNDEFSRQAERLAHKKISRVQVKAILDELFPVNDDEIGRIKLDHLMQLRTNFDQAYDADDLVDFKGTAWGVLNAFSDMIYHGGANFRHHNERSMMSAINGNKLYNKAQALVMSA